MTKGGEHRLVPSRGFRAPWLITVLIVICIAIDRSERRSSGAAKAVVRPNTERGAEATGAQSTAAAPDKPTDAK